MVLLKPMPGLLGPLRPMISPILEWAAKRRLNDAVNIADIRRCCELRMHHMCFGYLDGGADDEVSFRRSQDAYLAYDMIHHVLSGVGPETLDTSTKIFGKDSKLPFFACPTAGQRMFHTSGESAVAAVAAKTGTPYCLSTLATSWPEVESTDANPARVFQVYVWKDRDMLKDVLIKAKAAGFDTLALTVDMSWFGNRERDKRNHFTIPPEGTNLKHVLGAMVRPAWAWDFISTPNYTYALLDHQTDAESLAATVSSQFAPEFNWKDAEWLIQEWGGPTIAIKGVVAPEDAKAALSAGFSSIWISNHGGRQLDRSIAPLDALPAIRRAVGDEIEVVIDGGIRRGTDIVTALALGADAVGIGKPYLFGLGAGGQPGVQKVFDILTQEVRTAMGLLGVHSIAELRASGSKLLYRRPMYSPRDHLLARYAPSSI